MRRNNTSTARAAAKPAAYVLLALIAILAMYAFFSRTFGLASYTNLFNGERIAFVMPQLDTAEYDRRSLALALATSSEAVSDAMVVEHASSSQNAPWPVQAPYPKAGALLPFNRIVAYYGNFYSRAMGALGEYDEDEMLRRLRETAAEWEAADSTTPVIPAIHYIVETAQAGPTKNGLYVARMPDDQVEKALALAEKVGGVVFLDFQVGLSTVAKELPLYEKYLALPNVHVGIDPEFSMKSGAPPGRVIGTYDAEDVNWVARYLAQLADAHDLPPKVLVIHRFTKDMLTGTAAIEPLPQVQIVIHMDGWGSPQRKFNTYYHVVASEPVQFTGFKIFYKNDLKEDPQRLLAPSELLALKPRPVYIQYQ